MTVADDVTLDDLIMAKDDLSGADIKARATSTVFFDKMETGAFVALIETLFVEGVIKVSPLSQTKSIKNNFLVLLDFKEQKVFRQNKNHDHLIKTVAKAAVCLIITDKQIYSVSLRRL